MTPELAYIIKVNVAFVLFYAFYRLFFYKDTFFKLRRTALLAFFALSLLYPLMNIQEWIKEQEPIVEFVYVYAGMLPEVSIEGEQAAAASLNWSLILERGLLLVYLAGVIFLLIRFFSQLGSILWIARKSRKLVLFDTPVYGLLETAGPFSFFRMIFLHPESHTSKEVEEILTHEKTHVSQWHSIDVMISELFTIIYWFNPFVWLLKREVRHNLEYLADNRVLESGYDSKSYQYHLLGLAHQPQSGSALYNSFNVLHLKNRIIMMNKKRSHGIFRAKYLAFIPLVGMLMLMSNIDALARMTGNIAETLLASESANVRESAPAENADSKEVIFTIVQKMPAFPGGEEALLDYIKTNVEYPESALSKGVEGRVILNFIIDKEGNVSNTEVLRGVDPDLDREAVRIVESMPRWTPGQQNGKEVSVKYTLPVNFTKPVKSADKTIFTVVEKMPEFIGGEESLLRFLNSRIKYPVLAQENGIQGRVICSFIIDEEGNVGDVEIVRGIDPSLDREAMRVIALSPRWEPGRQRGVPVSVKYTLPIVFRLQ